MSEQPLIHSYVFVHRCHLCCPPTLTSQPTFTGTWASNLQMLHNTSPAVQLNLKSPPQASTTNGGSADTDKSHILLASMYSDKTNYGNSLYGYPFHMVGGNGNLDDTNELLSTSSGLVGFIPILPINTFLSDDEMTQLRSDFLRVCLDRLLRQVKCEGG